MRACNQPTDRYESRNLLYVYRDWPDLSDNPLVADLLARKESLACAENYPDVIAMFRQLLLVNGELPRRLLSVGCGWGINLLEFASWGIHSIGLDTVAEYCQGLVNLGKEFRIPVAGLAGDGCSLPFVDCSFDMVASESVFEHIYDTDAAIAEQIRVLRPGGKLLILDGNILNPRLLFDLLVMYAIRTRGRRGGVDWLLNRKKLRLLGEGMYSGRDEDVHSPGWWRQRLSGLNELRVLKATTTARYVYPSLPKPLMRFVGMCLVLAERV